MIISHHIRKFETLCCSYADAENGRIMERNSYYPFGLQTNQGESYPTLSSTITSLYPNILSATQTKRDLYNGKEIQTVAGTDYLDYGFRQYDPVTARWMAVDPKAEKYLPLTPYNFCAGNPISIFDNMGDSLTITGVSANEALKQLQDRAGDSIVLKIDEKGNVSYEEVRGKRFKRRAREIARFIDNSFLIVNLETTSNETINGRVFTGGAFMGNTINGEKVYAKQIVNTSILNSIDDFFGTPGQSIWHELTEAFIGAKISKLRNMPATTAYDNDENDIFKEAHERASEQHPIKRNYYRWGKTVKSIEESDTVEFYVEKRRKRKVIQKISHR